MSAEVMAGNAEDDFSKAETHNRGASAGLIVETGNGVLDGIRRRAV